MSRDRAEAASFTEPHTTGWPLRILLSLAALEVLVNRLAVPVLRPAGVPPTWFVLFDYLGLFLFYFTGTLAAALIGERCWASWREHPSRRERIACVLLAATGAIAAAQVITALPEAANVALELGLAATTFALIASVYGKDRDLGIEIGLPILALPIVVHVIGALGGRYLWPESAFDGPGPLMAKLGVATLCVAALASPYTFAPRPFARAVGKPLPIVIAMSIAAVGAVVSRFAYFEISRGASLAFGVDLTQGQADPRLALYLLAVATLAWTLMSCAIAQTTARRQVGAGIALIVLGGYGFHWPIHYLLPLLGLAIIAEAARTVRDDELATMPLVADTPPISDVTWSAYIAAVATALKRSHQGVHSLTTRTEGGIASSVIVAERDGLAIRTRIDRVDGSVIGIDLVAGRELDDTVPATVAVAAIAPREHGTAPDAPAASPAFTTGDAAFDERFGARGDRVAFGRLFDGALRARAVATLDGWLAYWAPHGVRYRVYPGRGAPLDHPVPVSDLSTGRPGSAERLVAVVELIGELAARVVTPEPAAEPVDPTETPDAVAEVP